jgi:hypothetical protein
MLSRQSKSVRGHQRPPGRRGRHRRRLSVPSKGDVLFVNLPGHPHNNRSTASMSRPATVSSVKVIVLEPIDVLEAGASLRSRSRNTGSTVACGMPQMQPGDVPLFDLFDKDGISLADVGVYPETTSRVRASFSFAEGTAAFDRVLKKRCVTTSMARSCSRTNLRRAPIPTATARLAAITTTPRRQVPERLAQG